LETFLTPRVADARGTWLSFGKHCTGLQICLLSCYHKIASSYPLVWSGRHQVMAWEGVSHSWNDLSSLNLLTYSGQEGEELSLSFSLSLFPSLSLCVCVCVCVCVCKSQPKRKKLFLVKTLARTRRER
jgi:hypothetical protein